MAHFSRLYAQYLNFLHRAIAYNLSHGIIFDTPPETYMHAYWNPTPRYYFLSSLYPDQYSARPPQR